MTLVREMRQVLVIHECANFCTICGAECWHLKGTDVDTCRRGHHHPLPHRSTGSGAPRASEVTMHEPKPRFLAPIGKPRDYVDRPEIAVPGEPECIGPAILDGYAESNAFKHAQQHALDVALAQKLRPLLAAEDRIRDIRRRAKFAHVDLSHEAHIMERDLERARRGNRKPPARVLDRLERLEGALDGLAA